MQECERGGCIHDVFPYAFRAQTHSWNLSLTQALERDSLKDETVVVIFIFATAGLLAWALVKPWIDKLRERNTFVPLAQSDRAQDRNSTRGLGASRNIKTPRHTRPGGHHDGGGSSNGDGNGRGVHRGANSARHYDEDLHADQDAVDIVSVIPS